MHILFNTFLDEICTYMIRIDKIIDKLKEIPILEVAEKLGIPHKGKSAKCFMHDDKNPSLGFWPATNRWKCFVCDKGGDQVTLVKEYHQLSYVDACKWLADQFNIIIPEDDGYRRKIVNKTPVKRKTESTTHTRDIDVEIVSWIVNNARLSEMAKDFLYNQRKYKPEIVDTLKIGSITNPKKLVEAIVNRFGLERSFKSGIVCQNNYGLYLFFRTPCLIFPYTDIDGNIVNMQTRYLGTDKKVPRFQFLPESVTGMFNKSILNTTSVDDKLFVAEGITDCIALLSTGRKAVAIPSATLLHDEDVKLIATKNLFMYPDKDEAGERLYDNLCKRLSNYGSMIMKLKLPDGNKDFSDYYLTLISDNG